MGVVVHLLAALGSEELGDGTVVVAVDWIEKTEVGHLCPCPPGRDRLFARREIDRRFAFCSSLIIGGAAITIATIDAAAAAYLSTNLWRNCACSLEVDGKLVQKAKKKKGLFYTSI